MNRTVTLELPEEMLNHADEVAHRSGQTVDAILAAWIRSGEADAETKLLIVSPEHLVYNPYGDEAVAQALLDALEADKIAENQIEQVS